MAINASTLLLMIASMGLADAAIGNWEGCGGRLERALDALQRNSARRTHLEDDEPEPGIVYQQALRSAPLEMTVSRVNVKVTTIEASIQFQSFDDQSLLSFFFLLYEISIRFHVL